MRLLKVIVAVGCLVPLAAAWPLPENYDTYDDYYYDDIYGDLVPIGSEPEAEPEPEPELEPEPEPEPEPEGHDHLQHHDNQQPEESDILPEELIEVIEPPTGTEEGGAGNVSNTQLGRSGIDLHSAVPQPKISEECTHPPETGMCRGRFPMFYFEPLSRTCLQFVYGGCQGNANAFRTAKECYEKCFPVGFTRGADDGGEGDYLTLHNGKGHDIFTFTGRDAALRVNDASLAEFSVRNVYQLEFYFRTDRPHGLLAFLRQTSVPPELGNKKVQLYVFLRRGHLGVTHTFCCNSHTFLMKKGGMQGGNWHSALVKIDAGTGQLLLEVDGFQETFIIPSLQEKPHYGSYEGAAFTSRLWIGGVFEEALKEEAMVGRTENFHGCLKKIAVLSGRTSEDMVWHKGLRSSAYRRVAERCRTNCKDRYRNRCSANSNCIEHFDHSTCNCFGTGMDGRRCTERDVPILSLSNDGHVVHRLYEWMDRVHTYTNFISLQFRTRFTDSILFYGSSQYPEKQYLAASLTAAGTVYVEANLGGGAAGVEVGERLNTGTWHTLTLIQQHNRVQVHLNSRLHKTLTLPGEVRYFHLDPDFYIGSAPDLDRTCGLRQDGGLREGYECQEGQRRYYYDVHSAECRSFNYSGCGGNGNNFPDHHTCMAACNVPGLRSLHSFLGCLRNVFINDISVLWELKVQNKTTRYRGATKLPTFTDTCKDREQMVLLTLSTERAHVNLTNPDTKNFKLVVSFRPTQPRGVVAAGLVDVGDTRREWEIRHDQSHISFVVHNTSLTVKPNIKISIGNWQFVDILYSGARVVMRVNSKTVSDNPPGPLTFHPSVSLGRSLSQDYPGLVGCVRRVHLGGEKVELRSLAGTDIAQKDVVYDGCRVLGPCERPDACEHGTACTLDHNDDIMCNCTDSGYTGNTCYFSLYKSSCEEYRHIGYNKSGVYKIDVDGNGPLPPAFVRCEFNGLTSVTSTVVENNLPERYEVRGPDLGDLKIDVKYRDFTPDMLQTLISKSESCTQKLRYDCRRSPLKLSTHTWFASPFDQRITSFGSKVPGLCRCKEIGVCDKPDVACNCDAVDGLARSDAALFSDPRLLPVTSMVFLQDRHGTREESEGRITLGHLVCSKEATLEQTVSFSKAGVYLEVPAWREGSFTFSFKTSSSRALIAFQPAYHPSHATFRIALLGEKEVEFMYSFHGLQHRHSLHTARRLNTGDWQHVLIDIHHRQLRFLLNAEQMLIDIDESANLGVLDGSMFLGGMPEKQASWMNQEAEQEESGHHHHHHHHHQKQQEEEQDQEEPLESLRGCIRDLTLNHELVDLERYVRAAPLGVSASCRPSCQPNPCQNGAECVESWGEYECVCKNPLAHSGSKCEKNLNENAITFTTAESKLTYFVNDTSEDENNFANLTSLLLNFRTHADQSLILFTHDYLHNFLQLHLASPTELVLLFNSGKNALALTVKATEGVVFNGGQSVQVSVERDATTTTITVHTRGSSFTASMDAGLLPLLHADYEQFPYGDSTPLPGMVYYPHSFTKPAYFYKVYVGSANDPPLDVLSEVPGLVGCVRGLQVNHVPLNLHQLLQEHSEEGVKQGCSMVCDKEPCLNGGVCYEDFRYPSNFLCDCGGTSYSGPVCSGETAYTFSGQDWLSRAAAISPLLPGVVLQLAFSASARRHQPQIVAFLRSTDAAFPDNYVLVSVEADGGVLVQAELEPLEPGTVFTASASPQQGVNAFSGLRHAVRVEWRSDGLSVRVDSKEVSVVREEAALGQVTTSPHSLFLGGVLEGVDSRLQGYENFHGCISNVLLHTPEGKTYPLEEYKEKDLHITTQGLPRLGSCAGFPLVPAMVMTYRATKGISPVKGEEWEEMPARWEPFAAPPPVPAARRDTPMDNVVPAVSASILLLTAIIVAVLCVRTVDKKKRKKKQELMKKEEEERQALIKEKKKNREEAMMSRVTKVSAVEMTPLTSAQNGGTKVQEEVKIMNEVNQQRAPPTEPPPPVPTEEAKEEEAVEVRTAKMSTGDRPLSWDKSADTLPLIIGTEAKPQEGAEDTGSEGSSFDCTIDITSSPSSSAFPPQRDFGVADSPSSMRVQRGSNPMVYMDEDSEDSEPRLLRHGSLPGGDEAAAAAAEVVEPPFVAQKIPLLGDGAVQKITKSEEEDEIVVVDDYLEDSMEAKPEGDAAGKEGDAKIENAAEEGGASQQKEDDLAEAARENNQSEADTPTSQTSEPKSEAQEGGEEKERKETDTATPTTPEENEGKEGDGEAEKMGDTEKDENGKSTDSDDDFIELRPESEKVQDAERITSKTWQEDSPKTTLTPSQTTSLTADPEHRPTDHSHLEKHKDTTGDETNNDDSTEKLEIAKSEEDVKTEECREGKKDPNSCSEAENEKKEIMADDRMSPTDQRVEKKVRISSPPPGIVVSGPKDKHAINANYLLTQIYRDKDEEEEGEAKTEVEDSQTQEGEESKGLESKDKEEHEDTSRKSSTSDNTNKMEVKATEEDNEINNIDENEADESGDKEEQKLLDISTKLLLLDMVGKNESSLTTPESSPGSPENGEGTLDSPTYINLVPLEDNVCLLNTGNIGASPKCSPGNLTPLDPISEHDESEEEKEKEAARKISMPTLFKCKLSSGITNLSNLSGEEDEGAEEASSGHSASEDKAENDGNDALKTSRPSQLKFKLTSNIKSFSSLSGDEGVEEAPSSNSSSEDEVVTDGKETKDLKDEPDVTQKDATTTDTKKRQEGDIKEEKQPKDAPDSTPKDSTAPETTEKRQESDKTDAEQPKDVPDSTPEDSTAPETTEKRHESDKTEAEQPKDMPDPTPKDSTAADATKKRRKSDKKDAKRPKDQPDSTPKSSSASETTKKRRRKKGRVTKEKLSPVFLGAGVRTFSNPISYFGGPNIKYEEEEGEGGGGGAGGGAVGEGRQRNDSIVSTTSLD